MGLSLKKDPDAGRSGAVRGRMMYDEGHTPKEASHGPKKKGGVKGAGKIRSQELCPFTMKLSAMLDAGLPVLQCLEALVDQTDNESFQNVITGVKEHVEAGESFCDALAFYPMIFSELYVKMVAAGEKSGDLPAVCKKLAGYMDKSAAMKRKVKSALMYPTVVIIVATVICWGLVTFIVPKFAEMFASFGGELPAPTQMLMNVSGFFRNQWYILLIAVVGGFYGIKVWLTSKSGRLTFDRTVLRLPMFGDLVTKVVFGRMSRTFASLLQSGLPILQAVEICGDTAGNAYITGYLMQARDDIEGGSTLSEAFERTGQFPSMMMHMIKAGERTACIEQMLENVADFYEDEVDTTLEGLQSMLEPLLMVGIGSIVGGIVICMFLPIFKMGQMV